MKPKRIAARAFRPSLPRVVESQSPKIEAAAEATPIDRNYAFRVARLARAEPSLPLESVVFQAGLPDRNIGPPQTDSGMRVRVTIPQMRAALRDYPDASFAQHSVDAEEVLRALDELGRGREAAEAVLKQFTCTYPNAGWGSAVDVTGMENCGKCMYCLLRAALVASSG